MFLFTGKPEGTLEERWADLGDAADLVAAAPDDEILGEILALQVRQALSVMPLWCASQRRAVLRCRPRLRSCVLCCPMK